MTSNAIQKNDPRPLADLVGTYRSAAEANERLGWAVDNAHLISPATSVGNLPEGVGLMLSVVTIDIEGDTYRTDSGGLALGKATLERMAQAAGLSWNPVLSGRIDDCSHPYYVRWRAVAEVKSFDGFQKQTLCKEKEVDLRDGSPAARPMSDKQLSQARLHIQSMCESKAQLRCIRQLGIKAGYTAAELKKPFVAARAQFTGESDDPVLKRIFAERTADAFLGDRKMLYGDAPAPVPMPALAPPPVGTVPKDPDDHAGFLAPVEQPPEPAPTGDAPASKKASSGFKIPGGRSKNTPIEEADIEDLEYWAGRFAKGLEDGTARNAERDQEMLNAFKEEIRFREGESEKL